MCACVRVCVRACVRAFISLGKVFDTPEVLRVYIGSFWDQPPRNPDTAPLLQSEMEDLLNDLRELPRESAINKVSPSLRPSIDLSVYPPTRRPGSQSVSRSVALGDSRHSVA